MNTYHKFYPNVFVAQCEQEYQKGDTITLTTKYGAEHECIIFNEVGKRNGFFYYSIVRADGFNVQEWAKRKAERLNNASLNALKKSSDKWSEASEGKDFLVLAEPIKIGHHSEKRHRALIERNHNRMHKAVELEKQAQSYEDRASYWEEKAKTINLSMPESLEYFEFELEKAQKKHQGIKDGTIKKKLYE
jgi:hypothetical protein